MALWREGDVHKQFAADKDTAVQIAHYFICLAISLWMELQKSSTVHLPVRSTTGEL